MRRIAVAALMVAWVAGPAWPQDAIPFGWFKAGLKPADCDVGLDHEVKHRGGASAFVRSRTVEASDFGTLMQTIDAQPRHGKRVRLAGFLKTASVEKTAGLWMRVDGPDRSRPLAFDNMSRRGLRGTTPWTEVQVVLDVAPGAVDVSFGIILTGAGQIWADDLTFEVVSDKGADDREQLPAAARAAQSRLRASSSSSVRCINGGNGARAKAHRRGAADRRMIRCPTLME